MTTTAATERTPAGLAAEMAAAWSTKIGATADVAPGPGTIAAGWVITLPVAGPLHGQLAMCVDAKAAVSVTRIALKLEADPAADAVSQFVRDLALEAAGTFLGKYGVSGASLGDPAVAEGAPPAGAAIFDLTVGGKAAGKIALIVDLQAAAAPPSNARRLEAVLDVDLPLVVRFGRATMPLRALAVLGPGSVIDMGRSPDEPVELLVGDRLIARGEVVIVGGNYGVRITDLTQATGNELEARTS